MLGANFWIVLIDGLLRISVTDGIIVAPDLDTAKIKMEIMIRSVAPWIGGHGLQLSLAKTEIVILPGRLEIIVPIRFGDQVIETKPSAVYLGVTIDTKLTFA